MTQDIIISCMGYIRLLLLLNALCFALAPMHCMSTLLQKCFLPCRATGELATFVRPWLLWQLGTDCFFCILADKLSQLLFLFGNSLREIAFRSVLLISNLASSASEVTTTWPVYIQLLFLSLLLFYVNIHRISIICRQTTIH